MSPPKTQVLKHVVCVVELLSNYLALEQTATGKFQISIVLACCILIPFINSLDSPK